MPLSHLGSVLKYFRIGEISTEEQDELFSETLYLTLTRAAAADAKIAMVEVETIQKILEAKTGMAVPQDQIKQQAIEHAFETASFDKLIGTVRKQLSTEKRVSIIQSLADLIRADSEVSPLEVDYFNHVADLLDLKPSELHGLFPG